MIFTNFYHKQGQGLKVRAAPHYLNLSRVIPEGEGGGAEDEGKERVFWIQYKIRE